VTGTGTHVAPGQRELPGRPPGQGEAGGDGVAGARVLLRRAGELAGTIADAPGTPARLGRSVALGAIFLAVVELVFHQSPANLVDGVALGSLYGIMGVGLVLIYRTTRVVNFATAAIGAVPAIVALLLDVQYHVNYLAVLPIALVGGPLMGALTDIVVMRRFATSPRLIVTVATIGVAQTFAVIGFFVPVWMGHSAKEISTVPTPWANLAIHNGRGQPLVTGNQVAAIVVVVVLTAALGLFLRRTRLGLALRASAENADRASLLGVPVKRVGTIAWMLAGLLSSMAIFVQSPLIGVPSDATLGFDTLLYGLAAAVVARMDRIGLSLGAGIGVGILVFASVQTTGSSNVASAEMLAVILLALLVRRGGAARAYDTGIETWRSLKEFRPVPSELRPLRPVRTMRLVVGGVVAAIAIVPGLPVVGVRTPDVPDLVLLPIFGIVAVSLVVLTGWAGQISLGQFGLAGAAALVTGGVVAAHNIDFFAAMGLGIAAGTVAAVLIGLPAVRVQGMYLAVTTLAFDYAMVYYFMNSHYPIGRLLMPSGFAASITRPILWQRINLGDVGPNRNFYFLCLAFLALAMAAASSFRKMRSGRILIAVRDNQRAAASYSVSVVRTRLAAFAVSGGIAGMAGVLLMYAQDNVIPQSFGPQYSIALFLATVIGGLNSLPWAVAGAVALEATTVFGPKLLNPLLGQTVTAALPLVLTGPGLILTLVQYPAGNAEVAYKLRDRFLRAVAARHQLHVPSLVADRRLEGDAAGSEERVLEMAAAAGAAAGARDAAGRRMNGPGPAAGVGMPAAPPTEEPRVACPVCGQVLTLAAATVHEHLRAQPQGARAWAWGEGER